MWPDQLIDAEVLEGTLYDAQWYSYGANTTHGLRRKSGDKRKAVKAALLHPNGVKLSNVQIALHVGVSDKTVASVRRELEATSEIPRLENRQGADGKTRPVSSLVKNPSPEPEHYEPQRVCNECEYYDDMATYCSVKQQLQRPWAKVCDKYNRNGRVR